MLHPRLAGLVPFFLLLAPLASARPQGLDDEVQLAGTTIVPTSGARTDVPIGAATLDGAVLVAGTAFGVSVGRNPFLLALRQDGTELWSWFGLEVPERATDLEVPAAGTSAFLALVGNSGVDRVVRIEHGSVVWSTVVTVGEPQAASSRLLQLAASEDGARLFLMSESQFNGPDYLIALDGADGSIDWVRETTPGMEPVALDCDAAGTVAVVTLEAPNAAFQDRAIAYEGGSGAVRFIANLASILQDGTLTTLCVEPNGQRAFVGSLPKPGATVDLAGLELQSGGLLWVVGLGQGIAALAFDAAGSNLLVASEIPQNLSTSNVTLHSVRPAFGQAQWSRSLGEPRNRSGRLTLAVDASGTRGVVHYDSTPNLPFGDDALITTLSGFDVFDGAPLWESTVDLPVEFGDLTAGAFLAAENGPLVVSARSAQLPGSDSTDLLASARGAADGVVAWETVRAFDAVQPRAEALIAPPESPVVFATAIDAEGARQLVALDPLSRDLLWTTDARLSFSDFDGFGPASRFAAAADGSAVYQLYEPATGSTSQLLEAYDGASGQLLWFDNLSGESLGVSVDLELAESPAGDTLVSLHRQSFETQMRASSTSGQLLWSFDYPSSPSSGFVNWSADVLELDAANGRALALIHKAFPERQLILLARDLETGLLQTDVVLDDATFSGGPNLGTPEGYDLDLSADGAAVFLSGDFDSQGAEPARVVAARVDVASGAVAWTASATPVPGARYQRGEAVLAEPAGTLVAIAETAGVPDQLAVALVGLRSDDGALAWERTYGAPGDPRSFLDAEPGPDGAQVLVSLGRADGVPQVVALDAATGAELWSAELPSESSGDFARSLAARDGSVFGLVGSSVSIVDGAARVVELQPNALVSGPPALSLAAPTPLVFALDRPATSAGAIHLLLGSLSTSSPGLPVDGQFLPLQLDGYLSTTLNLAGQGAFAETIGLLDEAGRARIEIDVPTGLPPALIGTERFHAFLEFDLTLGLATFASETVRVTFAP